MKNLLSSLVVIVAIVVLWQMFAGQRDTLLVDDMRQESGVDAYMKRFTMRAMDDDGRATMTVSAATLKHIMQEERSELESLDIRFADAGRSGWRITAARGSIDQLRRELRLRDQVDMRREDGERELRVLTDAIDIDIDRQVMRTDSRVELRLGASVLQSSGMLMDNREGTLRLLSQVEGQHALD